MAATNFSRDILEQEHNITRDLIDFETIIETPVDEGEHDMKSRLVDVEKFRKNDQKLYNHCDWLEIGKKESCGKRCKQFYCSPHTKYINKGGEIPLPCITCGVGVSRLNHLCTRYEKKICGKC